MEKIIKAMIEMITESINQSHAGNLSKVFCELLDRIGCDTESDALYNHYQKHWVQ